MSCHLSCLDYCNRFLTGLPASLLLSVRSVWDTTGRMILLKFESDVFLPLTPFQWLPILSRVKAEIHLCSTKSLCLARLSVLTFVQSFSCFLESVSLASWHPPFPPTLGSSHWPLSHPECSSLTLPSWLLPSRAFLKKHLLSKSSLTTLSKITVPLAPYLSPFLLYIFPL